MLNLILATLCSASVSVIMRISGKYIHNQLTMLACNYVMCSILGGSFAGGQLFPRTDGLALAIVLGIIGGFFYLTSFMLMQKNVKQNGVVLPTTFMKLGIVIPVLSAILVFGEAPRMVQFAGIALALAAIVVMQEKGQDLRSFGSIFWLWLTTGISSAMSKVYDGFGVPALKNQFLFYIFASALVMCVIVCIIRKQKISLWDLFFGLIIGIPNYFSARFLLLSLGAVPAVVAYPTYSVGTIVMITLAGIVIFREKLNRQRIIALLMILCALALLNM